MKKLMVCLLAVSLSSLAMAQKIATVHLEEVIRNHPQTEGNKKVLLETQQRYEGIRDGLRDEVRKAEERFVVASGKINDASLSERGRENVRKEAQELLEKFNEAREAFSVKVAELQEALGRQELLFFQSAMDDIRKNLMEIVKAREIDLVIDRSAERLGAPTPIVLYSSDALDITEALIQLCKVTAERNAKASE